MSVELRLSTAADARVIRNLWPLYVHDVSEFDGAAPNAHGLFGVPDSVTTLAEQGETLNAWWRDPDALFPYLVLDGDRPVGFNLIAARPRLPEGLDADFVVHEFFVVHAARGTGVAVTAALKGFERHRGLWEIVTYPEHARGIAFWRRLTSTYTNGKAREETRDDHPWGRKVVFRFDNRRISK